MAVYHKLLKNKAGDTIIPVTQVVYSTSEMAIGKWIDGKILYRKVVQIPTTTISSQNTTVVDIPVSGAYETTNIGGRIYFATSNVAYPVGGYRNLDFGIRNYPGSGLQLIVGTSMAAEQSVSGWLILEYTKN